jgi:uncharacterized caspase-like protein
MFRKLILFTWLSLAGVTSAFAQSGQWALLIGVNDYPGEIQDLRFARDDARALKELLVASAAFPESNVTLLTDDGVSAARATKQNILAAIESLAARVQPNDQIIVFLAGHGIVRGLGATAKSYFLPVDIEAQTSEALERTALDMEALANKLSQLKASQFTIFVDACREDPFPGRGLKGNTMTDVMARGLRIVRVEAPKPNAPQPEAPTSVIFYACRVGERAYENAQLQHGVFTYFILRGLRELSARPDGRVEAGLLAGYLRDNVKQWATEAAKTSVLPAEQTPTMIATEVRGPVVIARVVPVIGSEAVAPRTGGVTLATSPEGALLKLNGQTAGSGPLFKELASGEYNVRAELAGFQPLETTFKVVAGYQQEITLTLPPLATNSSYERGVAFETQQLWPQAIASYEQALREDPAALAVYERLANVYLKNNREREAIILLSSALQRFPNNAVLLARRSRARSALVMPAPPVPVPAMETAPVAAPEPEPGGKKSKGGKGKKEESAPAEEPEKKGGKSKKKKDQQTADLSAFAFAEPVQKKAKSEKASGKAKKKADEEPAPNTSRAVVAPSDRNAEALRDAEQAVAADANLAAAHLALGFALLLDSKQQDKALAAFVRASTLAPDDAEAYYGIGYVYRLQQQFAQAIPQLKKAIALRPDYYEAQRELAYCYHSTGDTDQAIRQYQIAGGHRGQTKNADEAAANNLALASLYKKKGKQVGGKEGQEYEKAGQAYEVEAKQFSPSTKGVSQVLVNAGVSKMVDSVLPASVGKVAGVGVDREGKLNVQTKLPGNVRVKVPVKVPVKKLPIKKLPF